MSRERGEAGTVAPDPSKPNGAEVEALSLAWEIETGCDSIPTIRRVYDRTPSGAYLCIWPECSWARHDPEQVWRHVHTSHRAGGPPEIPPDGWRPSKGRPPSSAEPERAQPSPNPEVSS